MADGPAHLPAEMTRPEIDCTVYSGWYPLLARLHRQLTSVTSDFAYVQIKEKYGTLRCHLDYGESVDEFTRGVCEVLIGASTDESRSVCEFCGKRGSTRDDLPRIKTMCAGCYRPRRPHAPAE